MGTHTQIHEGLGSWGHMSLDTQGLECMGTQIQGSIGIWVHGDAHSRIHRALGPRKYLNPPGFGPWKHRPPAAPHAVPAFPQGRHAGGGACCGATPPPRLMIPPLYSYWSLPSPRRSSLAAGPSALGCGSAGARAAAETVRGGGRGRARTPLRALGMGIYSHKSEEIWNILVQIPELPLGLMRTRAYCLVSARKMVYLGVLVRKLVCSCLFS